jgi:hypothetical protein
VPGSLAESDDEGEAAGAPEHENDLMVVSRKFGHVFSEKLRKPMKEFAGMAKALETEKIHVLAKEKGLMLDAIPNRAGAQTRMKRDHAREGNNSRRVLSRTVAGERLPFTECGGTVRADGGGFAARI